MLVVGAVAFRFIEPAAARVDYRSFLIAFAATATLLLVLGIPVATRALRGQRAT